MPIVGNDWGQGIGQWAGAASAEAILALPDSREIGTNRTLRCKSLRDRQDHHARFDDLGVASVPYGT
mgnify:FL=1